MSDPLRVAIIGLDHWYTAIPLAESFAAHPDVELVGIADLDPARAQEVAGKVGVERVSTTGEEFLTDPNVDVIAAYRSTEHNPSLCVAAAENGKHILSIKPMANTLEEATTILNAVRTAGVRFVGSETRSRASANHTQLYALLKEGKFGQLINASFAMWTGGLPRGWPDATDPGWFTAEGRAPGGGWIDHSIYQIDQMRWMLGAEVAKVSGFATNYKHPKLPFEDYGHAIVEFENGVVATIEDTWTGPGVGRTYWSIVGTEGAASFDSITGKLSLAGAASDLDGWVQANPKNMWGDDTDVLVKAFRGEDTVLGGVEDSWRNFAVCRAFYEAAESGSAVTPAELPTA